MDKSRLKQLGLTLGSADAGFDSTVTLELGVPLVNPLSQKTLSQVRLAIMDEKLVTLEPAELVGLPSLSLAGVTHGAQLEEQLAHSFNEHLFHLQRRSQELQGLGLAPHVNPQNLQLDTHMDEGDLRFNLVLDKRGKFHVAKVLRAGKPLPGEFGQVFELSEFRERGALAGYLSALVNEASTSGRTNDSEALFYDELTERFGPLTRIPPMSAVECLVVLRVKGVSYRFAAARVAGRTFRGLLAGPQGKIWAERFELQDFPGVRELCAASLHVPLDAVEVLSSGPE